MYVSALCFNVLSVQFMFFLTVEAYVSGMKVDDSSEQTDWKSVNFSSLNRSAIVPAYYPFSSSFFVSFI